MTKRKPGTAKKAPQPAPKKSNSRIWLIVGAAAVVVAVVAIVSASNGKPSSAAPPEEQKYIGRLLPAGYQEPSVAGFAPYNSAIEMSPIQATDSGNALSIPLSEVTSKKDVSFEYAKAGSPAIPLIAYVKPSGKLFVGVNFCPPCQGKGQRIDADGTLTCTTCGTKRNPESQVGISGACRLYPLDEVAATMQGGKVVIDKAALDKWSPQPLDRKVGA